jgi:peptide subunit release factor RF-3
MKKRFQILLFALVIAMSACDKPIVHKPDNLIKEKQMIDMLVDVHLAEATFNKFRYDSAMRDNSAANFYASVLDKYEVPDTLFEQSYVYYASMPKKFEKMYREVMNKLSDQEQEFSGRKEELEFDGEAIKNAK